MCLSEISFRVADHPPEPDERGADLLLCNQPKVGWQMIEDAIQRNYCSYEALQNDPALAKSRQTPKYRLALSEAKACQAKFLSARKEN
jgi:hypothetical protein